MACIAPVPSAMIEDTESKVDTGLFTRPRTGHGRTLYSFRHTYAIFARINDSTDSHTLAIQMGAIILMVERHYSHVTPRLRTAMLIGKWYDLSRVEDQERTEIS